MLCSVDSAVSAGTIVNEEMTRLRTTKIVAIIPHLGQTKAFQLQNCQGENLHNKCEGKKCNYSRDIPQIINVFVFAQRLIVYIWL